MQFKRRGSRIQLYRSRWVPKGTHGNSHGYPDPEYVGSLPHGATEIPAGLFEKLSAAEHAEVELKVVEPARQAALEQQRRADARELDPHWRIEECLRLLREAAERSAGRPVEAALVASLAAAVDMLGTQQPRTGGGAPPSGDPVREALKAVRRAAEAIRAGHYGRAPESGVRNTDTYRAWSEVHDALVGEGAHSMQSALQEQGWVKRRARAGVD